MSIAIPKHYKLVKEHPYSYELHDTRDKRNFHIAKAKLDLGMHGALSKVQHFDEGGDVQNSSSMPVDEPFNPDSLTAPMTTPDSPSMAQSAGQDVGQVVNGLGPALTPVLSAGVAAAKGIGGAASDFMSGLNNPNGKSPSAPTAAGMPQDPNMLRAPAADVPEGPNPLVQQNVDQNEALQGEINAMNAGAQAEGKAGEQSAKAWADFTSDHDKQLTQNQIFENHQAADKAAELAYMNGTIDPNRFWNDKSSGSKVLSGIGLLLGGLGSGLSGQPNLAYETIQKGIQRDIDSQRDDQSKNLNLWKMNREATQSDMAANLATENQKWAGVLAKINQYTGENAGPIARARVAPMVAQIQQQMSMNNFRRSLMQASANGQMNNMDPANLLMGLPPQQQAQLGKEVDARKLWAQGKNEALKTFDHIAEINTPSHWATSPIQTKNQIQALRDNSAIGLARDEAGRVNEYEFAAAKQAYKSILDSSSSLQVKRDNLANLYDKKKPPGTLFKSSLGMDLDNFNSTTSNTSSPQTQTQNARQQWMKQNINNPNPQVQAAIAQLKKQGYQIHG